MNRALFNAHNLFVFGSFLLGPAVGIGMWIYLMSDNERAGLIGAAITLPVWLVMVRLFLWKAR